MPQMATFKKAKRWELVAKAANQIGSVEVSSEDGTVTTKAITFVLAAKDGRSIRLRRGEIPLLLERLVKGEEVERQVIFFNRTINLCVMNGMVTLIQRYGETEAEVRFPEKQLVQLMKQCDLAFAYDYSECTRSQLLTAMAVNSMDDAESFRTTAALLMPVLGITAKPKHLDAAFYGRYSDEYPDGLEERLDALAGTVA